MRVTSPNARALWLLVCSLPAAWLWLADPFGVDRPVVDGRPNLALLVLSVPFVSAVIGSVDLAYRPMLGLRVASRDGTELLAVWNGRMRLLLWLGTLPALMLAGVRMERWAVAAALTVAAFGAIALEYQRRTRHVIGSEDLVWSDPEMEALRLRPRWGFVAASVAMLVGSAGPVADGELGHARLAICIALALALAFSFVGPFYALTNLRFDLRAGVLPLGVSLIVGTVWLDTTAASLLAGVVAFATALAAHRLTAHARKRRLNELLHSPARDLAVARYGASARRSN